MRVPALIATVVTAALVLTACGGGGDNAANQDSALRVAVSPVPHAKILNWVKDNLAASKNIKIEVVEFQDYVLPNTSLVDKQLEANYFQHVPYLTEFLKERGGDLKFVAPVHIEPLAVFSKKVKNIADLPNNAKVALSQDAANQTRALRLLQANNVLKLKPGSEQGAALKDVAENPKNIKFVELEPAQLARSLDDTDASIVNGNYAIDAGLDPIKGSLAVEKAEQNPYANGLVTRPELAEDKRIKALAELLTSQQTRDYIQKEFGGAVIPA
ncbi:MetQ/NlpA family ABC transporter substrate-binding protein [Crossiella sp. CA-258035]|uniref:MetQ/NlpA family ABC transporter substrate-binding protein n=1 Tax=Crossiella sp. CA-258035 TaxID=2981138 RepID=UPI0024BC327D|nr:MetQ/NlpA family ABC transporter substrate-binding protein [Crossiella sp. CA-258035]WHT18766.1 MetQ/NlpA family ABC transporter substrate-binding protein [Crossiella sp. CA-258035]